MMRLGRGEGGAVRGKQAMGAHEAQDANVNLRAYDELTVLGCTIANKATKLADILRQHGAVE